MRTKKKNRNLPLIILCIVVLAVVVIAGILLIRQQLSVRAYAAQIETAESYVEAGDYESAVTAYNEAIEMNPQKESGYVDLAYLYLDMGDEESAVETLERGEENAATIEEILYILAAIEDGSLTATATTQTVEKTTLQTSSASGTFSYDTAFLQRLEDFTYENYVDTYGTNPSVTRVSSDEVTVVHSALSATFTYANTDDYDDIVTNGMPANDAQPESVTLDDLSVLFSNFDGTATKSELQALSTTTVSVKTNGSMNYVVLNYWSLQIQIETDEDGNLTSADAWNVIYMTEANADRSSTETKEKATYSGVIVDATTGEGVEGATVTFRGQNTGSSVSGTTDSTGAFKVKIEEDTYDVTVTADDYIDETFEVTVESGKTYSGEQVTISPTLVSGTIRIVLEWNAEPQDLDLYLTGETDDGDSVRVSYYNKTETDSSGNVIAELDVDDTNGYGPETITLYESAGSYTCVVKDYRTTGTMASYGATVKVYLSDSGSPTTIDLSSSSGVVNVWNVFELENGRLNILNTSGD